MDHKTNKFVKSGFHNIPRKLKSDKRREDYFKPKESEESDKKAGAGFGMGRFMQQGRPKHYKDRPSFICRSAKKGLLFLGINDGGIRIVDTSLGVELRDSHTVEVELEDDKEDKRLC